MLTPACDLVIRGSKAARAEFVTLVECDLLTDSAEYLAWADAKKISDSPALKPAEKALTELMRNNQPKGRQVDRHYYLPGAWSLPDLLVDFQRLVRIDHTELSDLQKVATLDSPYAEGLVVRFGKYIGRIGTPDLNVEMRVEELAQQMTDTPIP